MFITDFSVKRPVTALMFVLVIVVLGLISFSRLPIDLLPDLEFPMAAVMTEYEGVGPEEIEESVTRLIESSVNRVDGVKNIYSSSQRGSSVVTVEFDWGMDMNVAAQEIREKIDELGTGHFGLPEDSKRPIIAKYSMEGMPVMFLSLSGGNMPVHELKRLADDYIQNQLEAVEGIAWVVTFSSSEREILVSLDRERLSAYHIPISQVIQRLSAENIDQSSGHLKEGYKDYLIRTKGKFTQVADLEKIILTMRNGSPVYLRDVAQVLDTVAEIQLLTRTNSEPSVGIMMMKQTGVNTVKVCQRAREEIKEIEKRLPGGAKMRITLDQSEYINKAIGNLGGNALWGGILAISILFFFLRNPRPLTVIGLAIPISLLAACIPIYFGKMTLNMMSLGGLALAIGMLLDNSIVVLENIFRWMQEHKASRIIAAEKGGSEVAAPIIASTLTTIAVFVPIAFTTGIAAQIFREFALTISFSLAASLFLALTLVPMMASKILRVKIPKSDKNHTQRLRGGYGRLVSWALAHPAKVIIPLFLLFLVSLSLIIPIGKEFMPSANDRMFIIQVTLKEGTKLEETDKVADKIEKILLALPELETEQVIVGLEHESDTLAPEKALVITRLVRAEERKRTTEEVVEEVRQKVSLLPQIENLNFANLQSMSMGGGGSKPVEIKIFGKDLPTLAQLSKNARKIVERISGIRDVEETFTFGSPEMQIKFDREKCARYGLSVGEVSSILEAAIAGKVATRFEEEGEEVDVRVRLREKDRLSLPDLRRIPLFTPQGIEIQLADIAEIYKSTGPGKILRENQNRKVSVQANISQRRDLGHLMEEVRKELADLKLPLGYFVEYGGSYENMQESFVSLGIAFLLAILLVYMIMAAQFESLVYPFVIMFSIPFALAGVLWALFLSGVNLSANAFIGVIMLAGIVVNNGIVLVDYINRMRREGLETREAIIRATETRLRPILMTTLTTILGITPMVFMGGSGAEMRRPLALAVIGGLLFGTVVTLILIPVVYNLLDRWTHRRKKKTTATVPEQAQ